MDIHSFFGWFCGLLSSPLGGDASVSLLLDWCCSHVGGAASVSLLQQFLYVSQFGLLLETGNSHAGRTEIGPQAPPPRRRRRQEHTPHRRKRGTAAPLLARSEFLFANQGGPRPTLNQRHPQAFTCQRPSSLLLFSSSSIVSASSPHVTTATMRRTETKLLKGEFWKPPPSGRGT